MFKNKIKTNQLC